MYLSTWQAYNSWGGYDLYTGPGGYNDRSLAVSMDRPYDGKGADEFLLFERKLINLAERLGLPLAYTTSVDLDRDRQTLGGSSALISMGHDAGLRTFTLKEFTRLVRAIDPATLPDSIGPGALAERARVLVRAAAALRGWLLAASPEADASTTPEDTGTAP